MNNIVFLNGKFLPADRAMVSIFDRGFTYGDGVFETMRAYNGRVFAFDMHFKRLMKSAGAISIHLKVTKDYLSKRIEKLLKLNNLSEKDANVRLTVTRGVDYGRLIPSRPLKSTITIVARPLDAGIMDYQQKGISALLLKTKRCLPHIKSLNLLPNVTGIMEAKKNKAGEGLFTDGDRILEGAITNIFISDGVCVKTPPVDDGILPGITRGIVIDLARREDIKVLEVSITRNDLKNSKEAFLTNSIMEILPIVKIGDKLIARGRIGMLTRRLQQAYKDMVSERLSIDFQ